MNYIENPKLDLKHVVALYAAVGWTNYTNQPEMLKQALENSLYVAAAYENEQLVGLIRAVGDGYSILFIQDILVLPEYQRQSIGSTLLNKVIAAFPKIYQMHLLTDNTLKTKQFYESIGFKAVDDIDCIAFTYIK